MTRATERAATKFTQTVGGFAELGALFEIDPETDYPAASPPETAGDITAMPMGGESARDADPAVRLAGLRMLGAALDARRERDREGCAAALRELAAHDERLAAIGARERECEEVRAARSDFEAALAKPFGDPDWLYDEALRGDYSRALAEAVAVEAALTDRIDGLRREAEGLAAAPTLARLLAERRRQEEAARAHEDAAEANRRRSHALASAKQLRDAGSLWRKRGGRWGQ